MASAARWQEDVLRSNRREGAQTRHAPSGLEVRFWVVATWRYRPICHPLASSNGSRANRTLSQKPPLYTALAGLNFRVADDPLVDRQTHLKRRVLIEDLQDLSAVALQVGNSFAVTPDSLRSGGHAALQLFKPVLHDVDLRRRGSLLGVLDHQKPLAIRGHIIGRARQGPVGRHVRPLEE
jgi:hypothetical protein